MHPIGDHFPGARRSAFLTFIFIMENTITRFSLTGVLFALAAGISTLQAQEAVPAAGGTIAGSGGSVSYTVGQVTYTTNTGSGGTLTQGVQQPYTIAVISGIEEAGAISVEYAVYPNPANGFIYLKVEDYSLEDLMYKLYNFEGQLIGNEIITGQITAISLEGLPSGGYILRISDYKKEIKVFKIIKN
jgi:hypothetical protein